MVRWRAPLRVWLIILGTVFTTEIAVMAFLPWLLPDGTPPFIRATADAVLLTVIVAPVLWQWLVRPLRESDESRAKYLGDLFSSIEADRRRTALELHDGVGQSLSLLVSGLRSAIPVTTDEETQRRYTGLMELAKQALVDVKRLAQGLRPSLLDDLGLAPALERLAADVRAHHAIDLTIDLAAIADVRLNGTTESALFRIAQEAISNVVDHAQASQAKMVLRLTPTQVELIIEDNGIGTPSNVIAAGKPGHLGLPGMRERATLLGGEFSVRSTPGHGTRVAVRLPQRKANT